jgi:hypothetical protein
MIMGESSGDFMVQQAKTTAAWKRLAQPQTDLIRGGSSRFSRLSGYQ